MMTDSLYFSIYNDAVIERSGIRWHGVCEFAHIPAGLAYLAFASSLYIKKYSEAVVERLFFPWLAVQRRWPAASLSWQENHH
jgi:hypothetical protein